MAKSKSMNLFGRGSNESNAKAALALSVVILAFILFMFVNVKKDELIDANIIRPVSFLIVVAMALLVVIVYFVYKPAGKRRK